MYCHNNKYFGIGIWKYFQFLIILFTAIDNCINHFLTEKRGSLNNAQTTVGKIKSKSNVN